MLNHATKLYINWELSIMKERQDAWSEENDLLLAETVLRHVREGSTQLNAFEEVGDRLNRTSAACGFRWNAVVRHDYEKALALSKKQRKQRQRALGQQQPVKKTLLYTPPATVLEEFGSSLTETFETSEPAKQSNAPVSIEHVISFLQSLKGRNNNTETLYRENERLKRENNEMIKQNEELMKKVSKLEQSAVSIQEDYETLMKIMNRARKLVLFDEEERPATKFKMDRNGNLEKVAE